MAGADERAARRRSHHTKKRLRQRRTRGRSCESTSNPSGIIQNPSTGRKPRMPQNTSPAPMQILSSRDRGSRKRRPKMSMLCAFIGPSPIAYTCRHACCRFQARCRFRRKQCRRHSVLSPFSPSECLHNSANGERAHARQGCGFDRVDLAAASRHKKTPKASLQSRKVFAIGTGVRLSLHVPR